MTTARFYKCLQFENPEMSVYSIQPGAIATDMSREAGYNPDIDAGDFTWEVSQEAKSIVGGYDDVSLPTSFIVWLASPEARFLKGKYLGANWDVSSRHN
jgi:NAD(P)-dependent dehydrogenase (short-subunit alcohol dehydrogenase family)